MLNEIIELTEFICAETQENSWKLYIGRREDGRTTLVVTAASDEANKIVRDRDKLDPNEQLVWAEFDITGQGYEEYNSSKIFS